MSNMFIFYLFLIFFCGCSSQEEEAAAEEVAVIEDEEEIRELAFPDELSLQEMIIQNPSNIDEDEIIY